MKAIKVLGKKTGLGNCIQFIPVIKKLQEEKYYVYSDHKIYAILGVCDYSEERCKNNIAVWGYDLFKYMPHFLTGSVYGFKYRIKGREFGLGLKRSISFIEKSPENTNNRHLVSAFLGKLVHIEKPHFIIADKPWVNKRKVVLAFSPKKEKRIADDFIIYLSCWLKYVAGYTDTILVDYDPGHVMSNYVETPTLKSLVDTIQDAHFCVAADTGVSHLAQYLKVPTFTIFGPTSITKNKGSSMPYASMISCQPCYDHGRIVCTNPIPFYCNELDPTEFLEWLAKQIKTYKLDEIS